jgi:hypothetical protein
MFFSVVCYQEETFSTGRSLVPKSPTEIHVIKCKINPLHLQRIGTRGQTMKERKNLGGKMTGVVSVIGKVSKDKSIILT